MFLCLLTDHTTTGDSYVDWTCLDGYNFGPLHPDQWINFTQVLSPSLFCFSRLCFSHPPIIKVFRGSGVNGYLDSYANITAVAPNKPLMLAEFGCAEKLDGGAAKGKWISDALTKEIPSFPAIRAIAWFEWDAEGLPGQPPSNVSWPIETSNAAQAAWASGIQLSNYVQNLFKNLSVAKGNPIPPYSLPTPAPTTTAPPTTVAPTTPPPTTLRPDYVGCYRDQLSPRALLGLTPSTSFFNSTRMTVRTNNPLSSVCLISDLFIHRYRSSSVKSFAGYVATPIRVCRTERSAGADK